MTDDLEEMMIHMNEAGCSGSWDEAIELATEAIELYPNLSHVRQFYMRR